MAGSGFQEKINKQALKTIATWRNTVAVCWRRACEEDGIDPTAQFVVFSEDNKFAAFYNNAVQQWHQAQEEYRTGGYVGLIIKVGKAA